MHEITAVQNEGNRMNTLAPRSSGLGHSMETARKRAYHFALVPEGIGVKVGQATYPGLTLDTLR
jgi:hypothetical protein